MVVLAVAVPAAPTVPLSVYDVALAVTSSSLAAVPTAVAVAVAAPGFGPVPPVALAVESAA